jgi:hypothetical protein
MHPAVRLRLHVSEPFDFERHNASADLFGTTQDHTDAGADEWEVALEGSFLLNGEEHGTVLIAPRYVGEQLSRVFDALLGQPVRIAYRTSDGWHFAMTGMISLAPLQDAAKPSPDDDQTVI